MVKLVLLGKTAFRISHVHFRAYVDTSPQGCNAVCWIEGIDFACIEMMDLGEPLSYGRKVDISLACTGKALALNFKGKFDSEILKGRLGQGLPSDDWILFISPSVAPICQSCVPYLNIVMYDVKGFLIL